MMTEEKVFIVTKEPVVQVFTDPRELSVSVISETPTPVIKAIPMVGKQGVVGPTGPTGPLGPTGPRGQTGQGAQDLGIEGNNELEITGIENRTVIDSVSAQDWRWLKYTVAISKNAGSENKFYATEISVLVDKENINVSEYATIDNDGDMGTIEVSTSDGLVELVVIPNPSITPITVRFFRIGLRS
jgi:hypothetical protein